MTRTISAFTTVVSATLLAVVTVLLPSLHALVGPVAMSVLVIVFALAWPVMVSPLPRWGVSAALALTGLSGIWVVTLLPAGTEFSRVATELWLAPVGGAAALGVLLVFLIQTFTLPGGPRRFLTTAILAVGAVLAAAASGWTLLLRHKYEVALGSLGIEPITGVTWLMLTVLAALAVGAVATLLKTRLRIRMAAIIVLATTVAIALQFFRPGPLSVPAVIAAALTALIVALTEAFADSSETPAAALRYPLPAIAAGTGTTIVAGMVSYFVIHFLPW